MKASVFLSAAAMRKSFRLVRRRGQVYATAEPQLEVIEETRIGESLGLANLATERAGRLLSLRRDVRSAWCPSATSQSRRRVALLDSGKLKACQIEHDSSRVGDESGNDGTHLTVSARTSVQAPT